MVLGVALGGFVKVELQQQWPQQGVSRSEATLADVRSVTVRVATGVVTVARL